MAPSLASAENTPTYPPSSFSLARRSETAPKSSKLGALMRDAQHGNEIAYSTLFEEVLPILERLVRSRLPFLPIMDREDLVQDVLLSVHAARATYDPQRPFLPWLMAIAHNRMVDRARRNSRRFDEELLVDVLPGDAPGAVTNDYSAGYVDWKSLRRVIDKLPKGQRIALELLKLRQMSLKEASDVTGISITALKVSSHRAMKTLRASFDA